MKKMRLMTALLLGMLFTLLNAASAFADTSNITGHLDNVLGNSIAGWLWDSDAPDAAQTVTITVKDKETGVTVLTTTALANEHREDLASNGVGTGNYGFHAEVKWETLPDTAYVVHLSANGKTVPQTLTYSQGSVSVSGNLISLGTFKTTAYCPCYGCSEGWGRQTSSGKLAVASHTVAVDPRVIPIGSHLMIDGVEYVAEDIGGGVKGKHIDIYYNTHRETNTHGVRNSEVFLIQK